jgi:hypothetical protein
MITTWTTLLLTGLRGNGKTLHAVQMMDEFIKAGHPVYACNFEELTLPGVQFLDDPHGWRDLPAGSVLFVDEAQRFWRSRRSGDPPESITAMETQRHDGVRMVLLTQQPTYLDKHLRGLVDVHRHLVRRAGLPASQVYEWERCKDEHVDKAENVDLAEKSIFTFPKEYYGTYKSAEVHTVKPKVPMRLKMIVAAALAVVGLFWYAIGSVRGEDAPAPATGIEASAGVSAAGDTSAEPRSGRGRKAPLTREQYIAQMVPRIPGAPWSAPVYDDFNDVTEPVEVACMIGTTCRCITTQGTRYSMDQTQCRAIVRNGGMFNPYKRGSQGQRRGDEAAPEPDTAATETASPGVTIDGAQMTGYGDIPRADKAIPAS